MKNIKIYIRRILPLLFAIGGFAFTIVMDIRKYRDILNSDMAVELILGNNLAKNAGIVANNWYYTSELRILNTNVVYKIAFLLFRNDWFAARMFSTVFLLAVLYGSYIIYSRAIGHKKYGMWTAAALMWPFGQWYAINVTFGLFYVPHIVISLLSLALFFTVLKCEGTKAKWLRITLASFAFIAGLEGIRQLMVTYVPLFLACIIFTIVKNYDVRNKQYLKRILNLSSGTLLSSVAGELINGHILSKYFSFVNQTDRTMENVSFTTMLDRLADLFMLLGYHQKNVKLMSLEGIGNLFSIVLSVFVIGSICILVINRRNLSTEKQLMLLYCFTAIGSTAIEFMLFGGNESHWVPQLPVCFILIQLGLDILSQDKTILPVHESLTCLLAASIVVCSCSTFAYPRSWEGYSNAGIEAAEWLKSTDYTQGIATFWNSGIITELTNGQVEMWTSDIDWNKDTGIGTEVPFRWAQVKEHDNLPKGKVCVVFSGDEYKSLPEACKSAMLPDLIYGTENVYIYGFSDASEYLNCLVSK